MNNKRLLAISSLIDKDDILVDIGCDHAYLDIYLIKNRLCKKAIASDISEGALNQASINIGKYGLSNEIKTIISNGLDNIEESNLNTIVISGMGTKTILDILRNPKVNKIKKIIIQSNNNLEEIISTMNKRNFKIKNELVVYDSDKYYTIIEYNHGKESLNNAKMILGAFKKENKDFYVYLYNKNKIIFKNIPWYKFRKRIKVFNLLKQLKKYIHSC